MTGQAIPFNLDAEQGLLGVLLVDPRGVEVAADMVAPDDFYAPAHQRIAQAIFTLSGQGRVATPVTLKDYFTGDADLESVGGVRYLADLAASIVAVVNLPEYCRTVRDLRVRRDMIVACEIATAAARSPAGPDDNAEAVIEGLETELFALAERGTKGGPVAIGAQLPGTLDWIDRMQRGELRGMRTGIAELDRHLRIMRQDLVIVAGRPSMGKTAFAMTMAQNFAADDRKVLVFSLEMSADQLIQRLIARVTGFPVQQQLGEGELKAEHFREIMAAQSRLRALPLSIDDRGAITAAQVRTAARRHKRRYGLDVVIIDYLGLMSYGDRYQSKVDQIGEVSKALKALAKELDIAVILLSQLSRGVEGRESKRPGMADLRDSGNLEQDADICLFLYREEYYLRKQEPVRKPSDTDEAHSRAVAAWHDQLHAAKGKAEIIIDKFRQGQTGLVKVAFDGARQWFHDFDQ